MGKMNQRYHEEASRQRAVYNPASPEAHRWKREVTGNMWKAVGNLNRELREKFRKYYTGVTSLQKTPAELFLEFAPAFGVSRDAWYKADRRFLTAAEYGDRSVPETCSNIYLWQMPMFQPMNDGTELAVTADSFIPAIRYFFALCRGLEKRGFVATKPLRELVGQSDPEKMLNVLNNLIVAYGQEQFEPDALLYFSFKPISSREVKEEKHNLKVGKIICLALQGLIDPLAENDTRRDGIAALLRRLEPVKDKALSEVASEFDRAVREIYPDLPSPPTDEPHLGSLQDHILTLEDRERAMPDWETAPAELPALTPAPAPTPAVVRRPHAAPPKASHVAGLGRGIRRLGR